MKIASDRSVERTLGWLPWLPCAAALSILALACTPASEPRRQAPGGESAARATRAPPPPAPCTPAQDVPTLMPLEITIAQYRECSRAGGCSAPAGGWELEKRPGERVQDPQRSVTGVTQEQAAGYCAWAHSRLPTDAEWLAAATADCRTYPWGDDRKIDLDHESNCFCCDRGMWITAPGRYPHDVVRGVYDLHGNAQEWTADGTVRGTSACGSPLGELARESPGGFSRRIGFRCMVPPR